MMSCDCCWTDAWHDLHSDGVLGLLGYPSMGLCCLLSAWLRFRIGKWTHLRSARGLCTPSLRKLHPTTKARIHQYEFAVHAVETHMSLV